MAIKDDTDHDDDPLLQWVVYFENKGKSKPLSKEEAEKKLTIYPDAEFMQKLCGWWGKRKRIYRNGNTESISIAR